MKECFAIANAAPSLLRLLSLGMMVSFTLTNQGALGHLYVVGSLLVLITLLVGSGLGIIRSTLLVVEGLPALTEETTDLT